MLHCKLNASVNVFKVLNVFCLTSSPSQVVKIYLLLPFLGVFSVLAWLCGCCDWYYRYYRSLLVVPKCSQSHQACVFHRLTRQGSWKSSFVANFYETYCLLFLAESHVVRLRNTCQFSYINIQDYCSWHTPSSFTCIFLPCLPLHASSWAVCWTLTSQPETLTCACKLPGGLSGRASAERAGPVCTTR